MVQTRKKLARASLIALGLAALAPGSHAQSNELTIYGIVDAGVEYLDGVAVNGRKESLLRMSPSNQLASRWGLRATEDLGGGLSALFNLESGFSPDTGVSLQGGRLFGRGAFVGLQSTTWGTLTFGRQKNAIFDLTLTYDPLQYGTYGIGASDNAFFTQRADNAIKYLYKQGGFSTTLMYSLGRDSLAGTPAGSQAEVAGNSKIGRQISANVAYVTGPLSVAAGYDQQHGTNAALASETDKRVFLGMKYKIAESQLYAGMLRRNNDIPAVDTERTLYYVGARHPITPKLGVAVALSHMRTKDSADKATLLGTSISYHLSKRTEWYTNIGYVANSGASTQGVTGTTTAVPGENMKGIVSGLMHRF